MKLIKQLVQTETTNGLYVTPMWFLREALVHTKCESNTGVVRFDFVDSAVDPTWVVFQKGPSWSWDHMRSLIFSSTKECEDLLAQVEHHVDFSFADPKHGLLDKGGLISFVDEQSNSVVGYGLNGRLSNTLSIHTKIQEVVRCFTKDGASKVSFLEQNGQLITGRFIIPWLI